MAFKKGQSGNPGGRPKKDISLTNILKEHGAKKGAESKKARNQELAGKIWELALSGDMTAIKYIYDRIDGRPIETVNSNIRKVPDFVGFKLPTDDDESEDSDAD